MYYLWKASNRGGFILATMCFIRTLSPPPPSGETRRGGKEEGGLAWGLAPPPISILQSLTPRRLFIYLAIRAGVSFIVNARTP